MKMVKGIAWQGKTLPLVPQELGAPVEWDGEMIAIFCEFWPGHGDQVQVAFSDDTEGLFVVDSAPRGEANNTEPRHIVLRLAPVI